jgi:alcohol dehydrogenase
VDAGWLGRAVTAPFVFACGECPVCAAGAGQVCPNQRQPGFTDPGSFAELVVVLAATTNLVALPDGLDPGDGGRPGLPRRDGLPGRGRPSPGGRR